MATAKDVTQVIAKPEWVAAKNQLAKRLRRVCVEAHEKDQIPRETIRQVLEGLVVELLRAEQDARRAKLGMKPTP